jgi:hypothetical protein
MEVKLNDSETKHDLSIFRLVIEYIFIINLFRDINVNIIYYKIGQT